MSDFLELFNTYGVTFVVIAYFMYFSQTTLADLRSTIDSLNETIIRYFDKGL